MDFGHAGMLAFVEILKRSRLSRFLLGLNPFEVEAHRDFINITINNGLSDTSRYFELRMFLLLMSSFFFILEFELYQDSM